MDKKYFLYFHKESSFLFDYMHLNFRLDFHIMNGLNVKDNDHYLKELLEHLKMDNLILQL